MVHLTPFFVKLKKGHKSLFIFGYIQGTGDESFQQYNFRKASFTLRNSTNHN